MSKPTVLVVPANETDMLDLLAERPSLWEYMLFAYYLRSGLSAREVKWRDYMLGYSMTVGPRVAREDTADVVSERMSRAAQLTGNLERVISQRAQLAAFGTPGEEGDADMIKHVAERLILAYELLLDWADEFRSLRFHTETTLGDLGASMVSQPIEAYRTFVSDYVTQIESIAVRLSAGESDITMSMNLTFTLDPDLTKAIVAETERVMLAQG